MSPVKAKYRELVPNLCADPNQIYYTGGGRETELVFLRKLDMPEFAAIGLIRNQEGREAIKEIADRYIDNAKASGGKGFIHETATFRSSRDWGRKLGFDEDGWKTLLRESVQFAMEGRAEHETPEFPIYILAFVGPRASAYDDESKMTPEESEEHHDFEIGIFEEEGVDLVQALTMPYAEEAIGIVRAAQKRNVPVMVSFTVETDGLLPSGMTLKEAIMSVDAATESYATSFMINCAHVTHFNFLFEGKETEPWMKRIGGLRANASRKSHAELDNSTELDLGDPVEFGKLTGAMKKRLPNLCIIGGCCGSDLRHHKEVGKTIKSIIDV